MILFSFVSGLLQGATEFLPVSSSGHLVLLHHFLGVTSSQLSFDLLLHVGTFGSAAIYFRRDILRLFGDDRETLTMIVLANIPFVIGCVFLKSHFEALYGNPGLVFWFLGLNGVFLLAAHLVGDKFHSCAKGSINRQTALFVGFCQIFALIPGISRAGITITAAVLMGTSMREAFRFSFIMSLPAIAGAILFKIPEMSGALAAYTVPEMAVGILTAFVVGLLSLQILYNSIVGRKLYIFGIYCGMICFLGLVYLKA